MPNLGLINILVPFFFFFLLDKIIRLKDSKIATLEAQRVNLFHKLSHLSIEELHHQPEIGKWSIIKIVTHMILSEEKSVAYVLKKTQYPENLKTVGLKTYVLLKIMQVYLSINLKAKSSAAVNPISSGESSLEDLEKRWTSSRIELENLSKLSPSILNKGIFKHPKVGYMNLDQMLSFFSSHYGHHLKQISAIVEMPKDLVKVVAL
jgi:uncharacterized damage-inducible protein DinB